MAFQSLAGLAVFVLIAWALSENRGRVRMRIVFTGIAIQIGLALVLLKVPVIRQGFGSLNGVILGLQEATRAGTLVTCMTGAVVGLISGSIGL
ncbi:MAG: Na+ dependent nucleoside transporter N-terminal domain-containing protein [Pseudomonadota bacterium]